MSKRMTRMIFLITVLAAALSTGSWAAKKDRTKVTKQSSARLIMQAVRGYTEVEKLGFAWTNTYSELIYPAKMAWRKGKYKKAQRLAEQALLHVRMGKEQQRRSVNSGLLHSGLLRR